MAPHIKIGQAGERDMNTVVNMASAMLMQVWMVYHKDTFSIYFGKQKWTMLYGSKLESLIYSTVYKPLGKCEPSMLWSQGFRSLA